MKKATFITLVICTLIVSACAYQPPGSFNANSNVPGFWLGVFHGFICLFSLIGSAFWDIRVYAFPIREAGTILDLFLAQAFSLVEAEVGRKCRST